MKNFIFLLVLLLGTMARAQSLFPDSVLVQVHPSYDEVSGIHRVLFGKNYRKEWATKIKLPLIRLSKIYGGLIPIQEGGGMQTLSLRLKDAQGKEWVIRSVEKSPDKLLPDYAQNTFVADVVDDAMSGQHPFSALVVPPMAEAIQVPHTKPVIGMIAEDPNLGAYASYFVGKVCLLEEREPAGDSDNTYKMLASLTSDHDHRFDQREFLKARMLDLLLTDWDRHEDQWRWTHYKSAGEKVYVGVPRDRDQVFHKTEGLFPTLAALPWIDPTLEDFDGDIPRVHYSLYKTRFIQAYPDAHLSFEEWMNIVDEFMKAETDEVLEAGLRRLPKEVYDWRHDELITKLKERRNHIPQAMAKYYRFINRIVDLRISDKREHVFLTDAPDGDLQVSIVKLSSKGNRKDTLLDRRYDHNITKEIRLYLEGGDDSVTVAIKHAPTKLRIIGKEGEKVYEVEASRHPLLVYGEKNFTRFIGDADRIKKYMSEASDTANTRFVPTNLYNVWIPLATAAINKDDGFLLGLGFKYVDKDGFRKTPHSMTQQLLVTHSFATDAFRIRYMGEWIQAVGKADFRMHAYIQAPDNTMNFFGNSNESILVKQDNYRRFHRTRFDLYQFDPSLRWHLAEGISLSAGPTLQFYHLNVLDNAGRFINEAMAVKTYDSLTYNKNKSHLGIGIDLSVDKRNNTILPSQGYSANLTLKGLDGLNAYSKAFGQIISEITYYHALNRKKTFVIYDRVGGGISIGNPAFYQSQFLGGQGNLLGFLQNRFAGRHLFYNNFQGRLKLFNIASYILPGQLGMLGFYDSGRVWEKQEHSDKWHHGVGGGIYFAPAGLTVLQAMVGHSIEGWYPYIAMNFRL